MWGPLSSPPLLPDKALQLYSQLYKWNAEFSLYGKTRSEMVKPARSSKKKKKFHFIFLSFLLLPHTPFQQGPHTYYVGYLLFLLARSFKPPSCSYYCFRTTILRKEAPSEEELHGFSWAGGRLKPPALVPLPAFPPRDFFFLSTVSAALLQEIKPPAPLLWVLRAVVVSAAAEGDDSAGFSLLPLQSMDVSIKRRHSSQQLVQLL